MKQTRTTDFLEKESLGKLMWNYAIPCVISLLVAALYNIIDQIFIANASYLGSYGNAANTVVFPLTVVALSIAMMIGDGCCTFVSIRLGAKEEEQAHRGIGSSVIAVVVSGIVLMAIYLIFQEPILTAFGARVNADTFRLSKEYFFWITLGIPFYMFGQTINPVIRSDGSPRLAMGILLSGAVLNIIFDPICIYVLKWGMMGAAVATILGQIVSALLSAVYLTRMKSVRLSRDSFRFRASYLKEILPLGITSFLSQISIVLSMAAVLNMVTKYGARDPIFGQPEYAQIPTAVVGIVMKFFQIVISISVGLAAGCIPIAGYNVGAQRNDRVRELMKRLLVIEFLVGLVASALFLLFPSLFVNIFGAKNESVYYSTFAVKTIRIFLCLLSLSCLNKGTFIFLQSLGKTKQSTALSAMREILFGVSLPILLPIVWGLDGILFFMPISELLTAIASIIVIVRISRSLNQSLKTTEASAIPMEYPSGGAARTDYIVTISRLYGARGKTIGKKVAEQLQIPYYDSELLAQAAERSGLSQKFLQSITDENPIYRSMLYCSVGFSSSSYLQIAKQARIAQQEIIEKIAAEGPCVIVGRAADQILAGRYPLFRVFLASSAETRTRHIMERDHLTAEEAEDKRNYADRSRAAYYNQYSKTPWGDASGYDLCLNTDWFGIDRSAALITGAVSSLNDG